MEGAHSESPRLLQPAPSLPSSAGIRGRGAAGQLLRSDGAPSLLRKPFLASTIRTIEQSQHFLSCSSYSTASVLCSLLSLQGCTLLAAERGPPQKPGGPPMAPGIGPVTLQVLRVCLSLQEYTLSSSASVFPTTFLRFPWFGESVFPRPPVFVAVHWFPQG